MNLERSSGVLLHITSLPSDYGIGDMGPEAFRFIDFLKASGHQYWQILPLTPTDAEFSHSPYSSYSAFAGNPLLISPQLLEKMGYLKSEDIKVPKNLSDKEVKFNSVQKFKDELFEIAFFNFENSADEDEFQKFCNDNKDWLNDYALFKVLRNHYEKQKWNLWPEELKNRKNSALKKAGKEFSAEIKKQKFIQFLFFSQWKKLQDYAQKRDVKLFGDIPFYVNHNSADCWANPEIFKLDKNKEPEKLSGVPPDYFSEDGQLWGTPVYNWKILKEKDFHWWIQRLKQNLKLFDIVRLDHFRAFAAYWEVPTGSKTAKPGKWVKTPGTAFFKTIKKEFPQMPFIAEDLGYIDEPVYRLLQKFNFPGMKVLQFAFGDDKKHNPYLPFNHGFNNVVYTGTHDNNTVIGWFKKLKKQERKHLEDYVKQKITIKNIHIIMHMMALNSVAKLAIVPLQDLIGLGEEAIMNIPGTSKGNWDWRATSAEISKLDTQRLKGLNEVYGRI